MERLLLVRPAVEAGESLGFNARAMLRKPRMPGLRVLEKRLARQKRQIVRKE